MTAAGGEPERHVREAAAIFGIELSEDAVAEYVKRVEGANALAGRAAGRPLEAEVVDDAKSGSDQYNAFRYEFTLRRDDGPLADLSVAVKDNVAVAGVPMTCGSDTVEFQPEFHATVTDRLLDAGAELVGTTNMDEFAYFTTGESCAHGRTGNPRVEGGVPGGSSSGSGAAVAGGLVDAALGSDTGGSIRIPASFCGVVGLKPTYSTVSRYGFGDLSPSLDHVGPLAPDVETAARVFDALAGPDPRDPSTFSTPRTQAVDELDQVDNEFTVAVVEEAVDNSDDTVVAQFEDAMDDLAAAGVEIHRVSLPGFESMAAVTAAITNAEFASLVRNNGHTYDATADLGDGWRAAVAAANRTGSYTDTIQDALVVSTALDDSADGEPYVQAQAACGEFTDVVADSLTAVDVLVLPTTQMTTPEFGEITTEEDLFRTIANTSPFNATGHPALSVPCSDTDGRPVGFQIVTDWNDEPTALAIGKLLETV